MNKSRLLMNISKGDADALRQWKIIAKRDDTFESTILEILGEDLPRLQTLFLDGIVSKKVTEQIHALIIDLYDFDVHTSVTYLGEKGFYIQSYAGRLVEHGRAVRFPILNMACSSIPLDLKSEIEKYWKDNPKILVLAACQFIIMKENPGITLFLPEVTPSIRDIRKRPSYFESRPGCENITIAFQFPLIRSQISSFPNKHLEDLYQLSLEIEPSYRRLQDLYWLGRQMYAHPDLDWILSEKFPVI